MKTIWKFQLSIKGEQEIKIPKRSKLLSIQIQYSVPCLWVLVPKDENKMEVIKLRTVGTGHHIDFDSTNYVGSYQLYEGKFVGHVFKLP